MTHITEENDNSWNPGHTIGGGYPFERIESKALWPVRPVVKLNREDNKVYFDPGNEKYNEPFQRTRDVAINFGFHYVNNNNGVKFTMKDIVQMYDNWRNYDENIDFEDFMMHRCAEFAEALEIAEGQIEDMLKEDPFSPDLLGFDVVYSNKDTSMPPVEIYVSRYDSSFSMYRDPSGEESKWILMKKIDDGPDNIQETKLYLPCQRIAYAALSALMVPMRSKSNYVGGVDPIASDTTKSFAGDIFENGTSEKLKITDGVFTKEWAEKFAMPGENTLSMPLKNDLSVLSEENKNTLELYEQGHAMQKLLCDEVIMTPLTEAFLNDDHKEYNRLQLKKYVEHKKCTHAVVFSRGDAPNKIIRMEVVKAADDKDAISKVKFLLETDMEEPITDIKFEELSIVDLS